MSSTLMPSDMHDKMKDTENRVPRTASLPPRSSGSATIQRKFLNSLSARSSMFLFTFLPLLDRPCPGAGSRVDEDDLCLWKPSRRRQGPTEFARSREPCRSHRPSTP